MAWASSSRSGCRWHEPRVGALNSAYLTRTWWFFTLFYCSLPFRTHPFQDLCPISVKSCSLVSSLFFLHPPAPSFLLFLCLFSLFFPFLVRVKPVPGGFRDPELHILQVRAQRLSSNAGNLSLLDSVSVPALKGPSSLVTWHLMGIFLMVIISIRMFILLSK